MVTDPISDMITRIKNAGAAQKSTVLIPFSKIKKAIAETLVRAGYLKKLDVVEKSNGKKAAFKFLELTLSYKNSLDNNERKIPKIGEMKRFSKVSRRLYSGVSGLRPVRQGYGAAILTTTKGVMTDKEARQQRLGGEVLLRVW